MATNQFENIQAYILIDVPRDIHLPYSKYGADTNSYESRDQVFKNINKYNFKIANIGFLYFCRPVVPFQVGQTILTRLVIWIDHSKETLSVMPLDNSKVYDNLFGYNVDKLNYMPGLVGYVIKDLS